MRPNEQYTFLILLHPNDKTLNARVEKEELKSSKPGLPPIPRRRGNSAVSNTQQQESELEQNLCEIETTVDVLYEIQGLNSLLIKEHQVKWNAVLKRGLFASVKCMFLFNHQVQTC